MHPTVPCFEALTTETTSPKTTLIGNMWCYAKA
jgi:hypothetical protein